MTTTENAKAHARIAETVFPNLDVTVDLNDNVWIGHPLSMVPEKFNLLATDADGNPTTQAKADALDVLAWMNMYFIDGDGNQVLNEVEINDSVHELLCSSPSLRPCDVFNAAKAMLGIKAVKR